MYQNKNLSIINVFISVIYRASNEITVISCYDPLAMKAVGTMSFVYQSIIVTLVT